MRPSSISDWHPNSKKGQIRINRIFFIFQTFQTFQMQMVCICINKFMIKTILCQAVFKKITNNVYYNHYKLIFGSLFITKNP